MKARTQTLQDNKADLYGGGLDRFLFSPLRDHAADPAIKRVDEILRLLVAAEAYRQEEIACIGQIGVDFRRGGLPEVLKGRNRKKEAERSFYQTLELLNIKLSRYRWEASLSGNIDGFRSEINPAYGKDKWGYSGRGDGWDATELWKYSEYTESFLARRDELLTQMGKKIEPSKSQKSQPSQSPWEFMEPFMVASLLEAVNAGEIWRYRQCSECHQWFYAVRGHQHFCADICRRKHEAQSPTFKQKRARYMRETYRPNEKKRDALAKRQAAHSPSGKKSKKGGK